MKKAKNQYIAPKILFEDTIGDFYFDDTKSENLGTYLRSFKCMTTLIIVLGTVKFLIA